MLCLISIYLLNCALTKADTIIYAHSVKEREAQTGQVPQRKWGSHHLGPDTGAAGLHHSAVPLPGRRVSRSKAANLVAWRRPEHRPRPGSRPMCAFLWACSACRLSAWPPPRSTAMSKRCRLWGCYNSFGDWRLRCHNEQLKYCTCAHWASHFVKIC